ncbi:MAG: DUF5674 family protein [Patescibacteria group bacterium]
MFKIEIVKKEISLEELKKIAEKNYGDMVKAVVDIKQGIIAVGGEWHVDAEQVLLENGSRQTDLWGINLYPNGSLEKMIEYNSLINIRPREGNRRADIDLPEIREKISKIIFELIKQ